MVQSRQMAKKSKRERFIRLFGKLLPIWSLQMLGDNVQALFTEDIAKARAAKDFEKSEELRQQAVFEASEYWDKADELHTRNLIRKATRHYIPTSKYLARDNRTRGSYGEEWLTPDAYIELGALVGQKWRDRWEF